MVFVNESAMFSAEMAFTIVWKGSSGRHSQHEYLRVLVDYDTFSILDICLPPLLLGRFLFLGGWFHIVFCVLC